VQGSDAAACHKARKKELTKQSYKKTANTWQSLVGGAMVSAGATMNNFQLIRPNVQYLEEIRDYREESLRDVSSKEDFIYGSAGLHNFENPACWIEHCKLLEKSETLPDNTFVESDAYLFVQGKRILGMINCRRRLDNYFSTIGGHIGFSVRPSERGKGYGSKMLAMALYRYRELGFDKVLVTCVSENIASRKIIIANGGVFESTLLDKSDGSIMERYWINVNVE
jgi:predicted acetyltransferase